MTYWEHGRVTEPTRCHGLRLGWLHIIAAVSSALAVCGGKSVAVDNLEQVLQVQQQRIVTIQRATEASISVFANEGQGGGSGVVISPNGYALSNFHVTKPAGEYMKCSMPDGQLYDAVIVGIDPTGDVALIKLIGRNDFPCADLGDSDLVQAGDWCFAVGNPFLLATDFQPTVTYGIVSGVHRYQYPAGTLLEYADCIQTDTSVNPGNSGGPLFNAKGQLIGINGRCSFEKRGRVNVGVAYAISINQIKHFLGYLKSGRIVDHATLGAVVSHDEDGRVIVTNILDSSDAYRRGLRYGDQILSFAGRSVGSVNEFKNILGTLPKGWRVPLSFRRGDSRSDVYVRLMGVHTREELLKKTLGSEFKSPEPEPPQPKSKPKPKEEAPEPGADVPEKGETPDHVAKLIEKRTGFANYYFNRWNRERIEKAFLQHGDFTNLTGEWGLEGTAEDGTKVSIQLGKAEVTGRFPGTFARVDLAKELDTQLGPAESGGLLLALHLWQRLLVQGSERLGEVVYLGTAPLPYRDGLYDVLVATHNVLEARFYYDPTTGYLVAMEMYPDSEVDPCEIYFSDYQDIGTGQMPHQMQIHYGDEVYQQLKLTSFNLAESPEKEAT